MIRPRSLQNKSIFVYLVSQTVSSLGDGVYVIAFVWLSLQLSGGKGIVLGGIFSIYTLGELFFGLISGPIADRYNKKRILIITDIARGFLLMVLYLLTSLEVTRLVHLYICTFLFSALSPLFHRTEFSILPHLVQKEQLLKINALLTGSKRIVRILSPMIGGIIIQLVGIKVCFLFDAMSFIFSSICISFIRFRNRPKRSTMFLHVLRSMKRGYHFIVNSPFFLTLTIYAACVNFIGAPIFPLLPLLSEKSGGGVSHYGVMLSSLSVGLTASSFLVVFVTKLLTRIQTMLSGLSICAIAIVIMAFERNFSVVIISCFFMGIGLTFANLPIQTLFQEKLPLDKVGVISSIAFTFAQIAMPISMALSGFIIELFEIKVIFTVLGTVMLIGAVVGIFLPQLRDCECQTVVNKGEIRRPSMQQYVRTNNRTRTNQ